MMTENTLEIRPSNVTISRGGNPCISFRILSKSLDEFCCHEEYNSLEFLIENFVPKTAQKFKGESGSALCSMFFESIDIMCTKIVSYQQRVWPICHATWNTC